jgi:hypothetical protein
MRPIGCLGALKATQTHSTHLLHCIVVYKLEGPGMRPIGCLGALKATQTHSTHLLHRIVKAVGVRLATDRPLRCPKGHALLHPKT